MSSGSTGSRGKTKSKSGKGAAILRQKQLQTPRAFILRLRAALFNEDSTERDVLTLVAPFAKFAALNATVTFLACGKMGKRVRNELYAMKKANMEEIMDSDGGDGWDDFDQEEELRSEAGRLLIARDADTGALLGYIHFAFSMQGELYQKMAGNPCLWVYSLQIAAEHQRSGLGRHLMTMCELIANKTNMAFVMFPVPLNAEAAEAFVTAKCRGYQQDDMAYCDLTMDEEDDEGLCVFAKCVNRAVMTAKAEEAEVQKFAREIAAKLGRDAEAVVAAVAEEAGVAITPAVAAVVADATSAAATPPSPPAAAKAKATTSPTSVVAATTAKE